MVLFALIVVPVCLLATHREAGVRVKRAACTAANNDQRAHATNARVLSAHEADAAVPPVAEARAPQTETSKVTT
jgi:hypothetical protein